MKKIDVTTFGEFRIKGAKKKNSDVIIEGMANRFVTDRLKEVVPPKNLRLDNYKKTPIILFNHDHEKPIGRALDIRPTEDGIYIKAKISKSKDPEISRIRDLIEEEILNSFSIGFNVFDEEEQDGKTVILDGELFETSVVAVPMNQDSLFSLSTKSFKGMDRRESVKTALREKGAWVAERLHGRIYELQEDGQDRAELIAKLEADSGLSAEEVTNILAGNVTPVPEAFLAAAADGLGLELEDLQALDQGDQELEDAPAEEAPAEEAPAEEAPEEELPETEEAGMKPEDDKEKMADEEEEEKEKACDEEEKNEKAADKKKPAVEVMAVAVSKELAKDEDEAKEVAEKMGYKGGDVSESEDGFLVLQADPEEYDAEKMTQLQLDEGVVAVLSLRKMAEPEDKPEEKAADDEKPEDAEDEEAKTKGGEDVGTVFSGGGDATIPQEGNPHLQAANQTNVLLGTMITEQRALTEEIRELGRRLESKAGSSEKEEAEPEMSEAEKSMWQDARSFMDKINTRIKSLESEGGE